MSSRPKTNQAILKRIKVTGRGKLLRRSAGQSHFNAKNPGKKTRAKRRLKKLSQFDKDIRKIIQINAFFAKQ